MSGLCWDEQICQGVTYGLDNMLSKKLHFIQQKNDKTAAPTQHICQGPTLYIFEREIPTPVIAVVIVTPDKITAPPIQAMPNW